MMYNGIIARYRKNPEENQELLEEVIQKLKEEINKW